MLVALRKEVQTGERETVPESAKDQAATHLRSPGKVAVGRQPGPAGAARPRGRSALWPGWLALPLRMRS